jgi:hypothetical protein
MSTANTSIRLRNPLPRRPNQHRGGRLPYEVRVDGRKRGSFDNLADALASARIAKCAEPFADIVVADARTDRMVIAVRESDGHACRMT